MSTRRTWLACAAAGLLAFVASYLFGRIPGLKSCGPNGGLGPIIAFEFVRSPADVAALFGGEPCRSMLAAAQRTGVLLDGLWFIPAYTAFLTLAAMATRAPRRWWVVAGLLIAGLSDEVEGLILWSILGVLPGTQGQVDALWAAVHLKFALLAVGTAGIGVMLIASGRFVLPRIAAVALIVMGGFALIRLVQGEVAGMMLVFSIGWFVLLAVAIGVSVWPSLSVAAADPRQDPGARQ